MRTAFKILIPPRYREPLRRLFGRDGVQWCRVVMNREIDRFIGSLNYEKMDVLEISGTRFQNHWSFRSYKTLTYPDYDFCSGPLAVEKFDLVIAEQVFEHILHPDRGAASVYQMLRPGGIFIVDTPFLVKFHSCPLDLYRWTQDGIRTLLAGAGFGPIKTDSWGNRSCLKKDMTPGEEWTSYKPLFHSLKNEPQFPIVVWAFAYKGSGARQP
jgi:SAM-dependent methyltransferase